MMGRPVAFGVVCQLSICVYVANELVWLFRVASNVLAIHLALFGANSFVVYFKKKRPHFCYSVQGFTCLPRHVAHPKESNVVSQPPSGLNFEMVHPKILSIFVMFLLPLLSLCFEPTLLPDLHASN